MARVGISKLVVEKARNALKARGLNPSIDAIRIELGNTGSKSTIHRYLKELDQAEGTLAEGMGSISEELTALVNRLAARLHDEAQARIESAEEAFDEHRNRLHAQAAEQANRAEGLQTALAQKDEALKSTLGQLQAIQAELHARQANNAGLTQACKDLEARLADKQQQAKALEEKHAQALQALEAYRVSSQAHFAQAQQQHDTQLQGLHTELRQAQRTTVEQQGELTRLNRDNERLQSALAQAEQRGASLSAQSEQLQAQVTHLSTAHGQAQGAREVLASQLADVQAALRAAEDRLQAHARELTEAHVRQHLAEQALLESKAQATAELGQAAQKKTTTPKGSG